MRPMRSLILVAATLVLAGMAAGVEKVSQDPVLDALAERFARLRNVTVRYAVTITNAADFQAPDPAAALRNDGRAGRAPTKIEDTAKQRFDRTFRYLDGWWALESRIANSAERAYAPHLVMQLSRADRREKFTAPKNKSKGVGVIGDVELIDFPGNPDVALGWRWPNSAEWLKQEDIRSMKADVMKGGTRVTLRALTTFGQAITIVVRPDLNYAIESCQAGVEGKDPVLLLTQCSDFRLVSGIQLPFRIMWSARAVTGGGKTQELTSAEIIVKEYVIDDRSNARETFYLKWPKGTEVLDARVAKRLIVTVEGERLTDEIIAAKLEQQDRERRALLERTQRRLDQILRGAPSTRPSARK